MDIRQHHHVLVSDFPMFFSLNALDDFVHIFHIERTSDRSVESDCRLDT